MVQAVPTGFHTVTPSLVCRNCAAAIDFYKRALGAQERYRMAGPGGSIMHAELTVGDSILFVNDEFPFGGTKSPQSLKGTSVSLMLYVDDVDRAFEQATAAGCKAVMPLANMFWGDRYGMVSDPYGHVWGLASHVEDVGPEEMARRSAEFAAKLPASAPAPTARKAARASARRAAPAKAAKGKTRKAAKTVKKAARKLARKAAKKRARR